MTDNMVCLIYHSESLPLELHANPSKFMQIKLLTLHTSVLTWKMFRFQTWFHLSQQMGDQETTVIS